MALSHKQQITIAALVILLIGWYMYSRKSSNDGKKPQPGYAWNTTSDGDCSDPSKTNKPCGCNRETYIESECAYTNAQGVLVPISCPPNPNNSNCPCCTDSTCSNMPPKTKTCPFEPCQLNTASTPCSQQCGWEGELTTTQTCIDPNCTSGDCSICMYNCANDGSQCPTSSSSSLATETSSGWYNTQSLSSSSSCQTTASTTSACNQKPCNWTTTPWSSCTSNCAGVSGSELMNATCPSTAGPYDCCPTNSATYCTGPVGSNWSCSQTDPKSYDSFSCIQTCQGPSTNVCKFNEYSYPYPPYCQNQLSCLVQNSSCTGFITQLYMRSDQLQGLALDTGNNYYYLTTDSTKFVNFQIQQISFKGQNTYLIYDCTNKGYVMIVNKDNSTGKYAVGFSPFLSNLDTAYIVYWMGIDTSITPNQPDLVAGWISTDKTSSGGFGTLSLSGNSVIGSQFIQFVETNNSVAAEYVPLPSSLSGSPLSVCYSQC